MSTVVNTDILNKKGNNVYLCVLLIVLDLALSIMFVEILIFQCKPVLYTLDRPNLVMIYFACYIFLVLVCRGFVLNFYICIHE